MSGITLHQNRPVMSFYREHQTDVEPGRSFILLPAFDQKTDWPYGLLTCQLWSGSYCVISEAMRAVA